MLLALIASRPSQGGMGLKDQISIVQHCWKRIGKQDGRPACAQHMRVSGPVLRAPEGLFESEPVPVQALTAQ